MAESGASPASAAMRAGAAPSESGNSSTRSSYALGFGATFELSTAGGAGASEVLGVSDLMLRDKTSILQTKRSSGNLTRIRGLASQTPSAADVQGRDKQRGLTTHGSPLLASRFQRDDRTSVFRSGLGLQYRGPKFSTETFPANALPTIASNGDRDVAAAPLSSSQADRTKVPVFVGPDGTLFDLDYHPVKISATMAIPLPPLPEAFARFVDFEHALHNWYEAAETAIRRHFSVDCSSPSQVPLTSTLVLPDVIGRAYYRPRVVVEESGVNEFGVLEDDIDLVEKIILPDGTLVTLPVDDGTLNVDGTAPIDKSAFESILQMDDTEKTDIVRRHNAEANPQAALKWFSDNFPQNVSDDSALILSEALRSLNLPVAPWDACMVPAEPDPAWYDSYVQFEAALTRWQRYCLSVTISNSSRLPPSAAQLRELVPIQPLGAAAQAAALRAHLLAAEAQSMSALAYMAFSDTSVGDLAFGWIDEEYDMLGGKFPVVGRDSRATALAVPQPFDAFVGASRNLLRGSQIGPQYLIGGGPCAFGVPMFVQALGAVGVEDLIQEEEDHFVGADIGHDDADDDSEEESDTVSEEILRTSDSVAVRVVRKVGVDPHNAPLFLPVPLSLRSTIDLVSLRQPRASFHLNGADLADISEFESDGHETDGVFVSLTRQFTSDALVDAVAPLREVAAGRLCATHAKTHRYSVDGSSSDGLLLPHSGGGNGQYWQHLHPTRWCFGAPFVLSFRSRFLHGARLERLRSHAKVHAANNVLENGGEQSEREDGDETEDGPSSSDAVADNDAASLFSVTDWRDPTFFDLSRSARGHLVDSVERISRANLLREARSGARKSPSPVLLPVLRAVRHPPWQSDSLSNFVDAAGIEEEEQQGSAPLTDMRWKRKGAAELLAELTGNAHITIPGDGIVQGGDDDDDDDLGVMEAIGAAGSAKSDNRIFIAPRALRDDRGIDLKGGVTRVLWKLTSVSAKDRVQSFDVPDVDESSPFQFELPVYDVEPVPLKALRRTLRDASGALSTLAIAAAEKSLPVDTAVRPRRESSIVAVSDETDFVEKLALVGENLLFTSPQTGVAGGGFTTIGNASLPDHGRPSFAGCSVGIASESFSAWQHPRVTQAAQVFTQAEFRSRCFELWQIQQSGGAFRQNLVVEAVVECITLPLFLDVLKTALKATIEQDQIASPAFVDPVMTCGQVLVSALSGADPFALFLTRIFHDMSAAEIQARASVLIVEVLASARGRVILDYFISHNDNRSLSFVAQALLFFEADRPTVLPWDLNEGSPHFIDAFVQAGVRATTARHPASDLANRDRWVAILRHIYTCHFVSTIATAMAKAPFVFVGVHPYLVETSAQVQDEMLHIVSAESNAPFMEALLVDLAPHRALRVSSLAVSLLEYFLGIVDIHVVRTKQHSNVSSEHVLQTVLFRSSWQREDNSLYPSIIDTLILMGQSKFSHVQASFCRFMELAGREHNGCYTLRACVSSFLARPAAELWALLSNDDMFGLSETRTLWRAPPAVLLDELAASGMFDDVSRSHTEAVRMNTLVLRREPSVITLKLHEFCRLLLRHEGTSSNSPDLVLLSHDFWRCVFSTATQPLSRGSAQVYDSQLGRILLASRLLLDLAVAHVERGTISASDDIKNTRRARRTTGENVDPLESIGMTVTPVELHKILHFVTQTQPAALSSTVPTTVGPGRDLDRPVSSDKQSSRDAQFKALERRDAELEAEARLLASDWRNRKMREAKLNLLRCLRLLISASEVGSLVRRNPEFFSVLLICCRDGSDSLINEQAWGLLRQCISRHNGVFEFLIRSNQLLPFLDLIGTTQMQGEGSDDQPSVNAKAANSERKARTPGEADAKGRAEASERGAAATPVSKAGTVVVANGLKTVRKLFSLASDEQKRMAQGSPAFRLPASDGNSGDGESKEVLKALEKDVKLWVKFWVDRALFIRLHMIHKRLEAGFMTSAGTVSYHGRIFVELASLYNVICTSPYCAKLFKDACKKLEYKDGLQRLNDMFIAEPIDRAFDEAGGQSIPSISVGGVDAVQVPTAKPGKWGRLKRLGSTSYDSKRASADVAELTKADKKSKSRFKNLLGKKEG